MTSTKIKRVFLAFITAVFLATSAISFFSAPQTNAVSQPTQKNVGCNGGGGTTGAKSPFTSTKDLCVGQGDGQQYYQFAVDFSVDVKDVSVTGKSGGDSPVTLKFTKESATRYVSLSPHNNDMGYNTSLSTGSSSCNTKDGYKTITIVAKANGQSQTLPVINLCGHTNINDSIIYSTTTTIRAVNADGTTAPATGNGTIRGNLGIYRTNDLVPPKWQKGALEQQGVVSIKLTGGPSAKSGTNADTWYTLQDGKLIIPNVEPGTYTLTITYNDKGVLQSEAGDAAADWTTDNLELSFKNFYVPPGGEVWLNNSTNDKVVYFNSTGDAVTIPKDSTTDKTTSCVIDGIGWLVCSAANFLASVTDGVYGLIQNLLKVPRINTDTADGSNGVYNTWTIMRNFANVGFVIGFLIIIFSQITSLGVSNYGVKKTLPRLIIAAVLVNVSYWLSAIVVDLSNILGAGLYDILSSVKDSMNIGISSNWGNIITGLLAGGALTVGGTVLIAGVAASVFAAGGGMAILFLALPLLLSAVLAVLIAAFVLIARQALVVLLIIVSPLAFVALLLPNTEKLFSKWRSALISLLLLYPIVSIVVGGAQIAGLAIMSTAKVGDPTAALLAIVVGQAVMVIPFFFIPTLIMKFSGNNLTGLASTALNKGKGLIGGISKASRKEGVGRFNRSLRTMKYGENAPRGLFGRGVRGIGQRLDQIKDQQENADKYLSHGRKSTTRDRLASDPAYATRSAAGSVTGGEVLTLRAQAEGEAEEMEDAKRVIIQTNMTGRERQTLAMTGAVTTTTGVTLSGQAMQRAAILEQFRAGGYTDQREILNAAGATGTLHDFGQTISSGVAQNGLSGKDPALSGVRLEQLAQGAFDYDSAVREAITEGKYTAEAFATMNNVAREKVIDIAQKEFAANPTSTLLETLRQSALGIQNSPEISGKISGNQEAADQISSLLRIPNPPTS